MTPIQALALFGCFRLSARIKNLRDAGCAIVTRIVTTKSGKRVAEYRIPSLTMRCSVCGRDFRTDVAGVEPEICPTCYM